MYEISGKHRKCVRDALRQSIFMWLEIYNGDDTTSVQFEHLAKLVAAYRLVNDLGMTPDVGTSGTSPDVPPATA